MSRYAESIYGEQPVVVGVFQTGDTVTIEVFDLSTPAAGPGNGVVPLDDNACVEVTRAAAPHTGVFVWDTANFTTQPTDFSQLLYIMTNVALRQHLGKVILGGYPSDSAIRRYAGAVWIDADNGVPLTVSGTFEFPIGTEEMPVDNFVDARTIAIAINVLVYEVRGSFSGAANLAADHIGWTFNGRSPAHDYMEIDSGADINRSLLSNLAVNGSMAGTTGDITGEGLILGDPAGVGTTIGVRGTFTESAFRGVIQPAPGGRVQCIRAISNELGGTVFDFNSAVDASPTEFLVDDLVGLWTIKKMDKANHFLGIAGKGCDLTLENTCDDGIYQLAGNGELQDSHGGHQLFIDRLIRGTRIDVETSTRATPAEVTSSVWGISEAALAGAGASGLLVALAMSQNTQIDFTGDDLLGWQLIINDTAGSEIGRADLYDEANARIPSSMSVAAFIGAQKTISRVVPS